MNNTNEMTVTFKAKAQNEAFSRMVVAAFIAGTNPTLEEVSDVKTAVSEAVTNSIIHGYGVSKDVSEASYEPYITIYAQLSGRSVYIEIRDDGCGIPDIKKAMEPMYTTKPKEDRSGMGFSFMEAFMDKLEVDSTVGVGTVVKMWKEIGVVKHHFE
ncbi:MAG: anti-sigma F factor [Lachnospiraceae bacterium]|nr:anti-sigma F factor [Lachnospiraceae bacterium]MBR3600136.1 anti-sigma F factor [Lachnospiraceae bacterium]